MDWSILESKGWSKKEFSSNGKKCHFYLTPIENGVQRRIKSTRYLRDNELCFSDILFPPHINISNDSQLDISQPSTSKASDIFNVSDDEVIKDQVMEPVSDIQRAADCLIPDSSLVVNLDELLSDSLKKINDLVKTNSDYSVNARKLLADLAIALNEKDNPFKEFPWNTSENIFSRIIDFAIKYTPDLIRKV